MSTGSGRAAGRARGRPSAGSGDSPTSMCDSSSPPSGSPARGRGGYLPPSQLVTRPPGTTITSGDGGKEVHLFANFFKVETSNTAAVYDYDVQFEPSVESVKARRCLVERLSHLFPSISNPSKSSYVFDGTANLKALVKLEPVTTTHTLDEYQISLKRSENPVEWGSFEMMRLYNTQTRRNLMHLNWTLIHRNYYDPATTIPLPQYKLKVLLGMDTAINLHDAGLLMCCDSINKILRTETVYNMMKDIGQRGMADFQSNCRREIADKIVLTSYNNKTYKVHDIDFSKTPMSTFDWRGRGQVTFVQYYQEQYNQTITDPKQPLIVCMPSRRDVRQAELRGQTATPHLLIPEFCVLTGLSDSLRSDFNLKKQLTQSTQLPPTERYNQLTVFRNKLESNPNVQEELRIWDMKYGRELVSLTGRELPNEKLLMTGPTGSEIRIPIGNPGDFSKETRNGRLLSSVPWGEWLIIHINRDSQTVDNFLKAMQRVSAGMGLNLRAPRRAPLGDDRIDSYMGKVREWTAANFPNSLVVCVFSNNNQDRYSAVKKHCYVEKAVASQCVLTRTLSNERNLMSVATKICLQMACKAGSLAWGVELPPVKNMMVCGYDTYHDGTRRGESVGAFVASLNQGLSQYFCRVSYHKDKNEMSTNIQTHLRQALAEYEKRNKTLPAKVVVYRDGVGEGMLRHVHEVEVLEMQHLLEDMTGGTSKLAFVVVTKKMGVKFFLKDMVNRKLDNLQPGTVVDTVVTRPERLEFYLVAQSVRAGTVAPTSFNIICNEVGWQPKHFQMMSYKLCHMYYNWPGTIRVPAPCQYAHKLAFLTGTSLHREPHNDLSDKLFYL